VIGNKLQHLITPQIRMHVGKTHLQGPDVILQGLPFFDMDSLLFAKRIIFLLMKERIKDDPNVTVWKNHAT
jgi:hypothetical protein